MSQAQQPIDITICGGTEEHQLNAEVFSNGKEIIVDFDKSRLPKGNIQICNTMGQELRKESITSNNMKINMSDC